MQSLPYSIEAYLVEAGFSPTEMLVLKKLLEEDGVTLRELASKTGKSTGVLDQAMKKLVNKRIASREVINGIPKYIVKSVDAISLWMQSDMAEKRAVLDRKQQDFESFIATLKKDQARPDIEYFDGLEGMQQAYMKLLQENKDFLVYLPITAKEEEDPLRAFRVEHFRARRRRGIFTRIISQNTPLGRRYQTRDPFEYRKTLLVAEDTLPFTFEKVITGDKVACINHEKQKACILSYSDLAHTERAAFELIWKTGEIVASSKSRKKTAPPDYSIPISTKTISALREFFLSRKSIATLTVFGVVAAAITYGLYLHDLNLNLQRIREKSLGIVTTGALQFDVNDLNQIHNAEDITKAEYAKVIQQLNKIRNQNEDVVYAYILRSTEKNNTYKFVADADSLNPLEKKDLNQDGFINEADALSFPGEEYVAKGNTFKMAETEPHADMNPITDQWGTFIGAAAPIKDSSGITVAILGIDRYAEDLEELSRASFRPVYYFIGFFLLFVLIRLAAFHRSLLSEIIEIFKNKKIYIPIIIYFVIAATITYLLYRHNINVNLNQARKRVESIASTAALQISTTDLQALRSEEDWKKPEWSKVIGQLKKIRTSNENILFVYIFRKSTGDKHNELEFVADSHSLNPYANTDADPNNNIDVNKDGKIDDIDILQWPGQPYPNPPQETFKGFTNIASTENFYTDSWGTVISGYAPIKNQNDDTEAVIAVDMSLDSFKTITQKTFVPLYYFIGFFILFILFRPKGYKKSLLPEIIKILQSRKILVTIVFCSTIATLGTYATYRYTLHLIIIDTSRQLESIAKIGSLQINPSDVEVLHKAKDMESKEYQNIFMTINQVRDDYPDIKWSYVLRPVETPYLWEFVADADSNYNIPSFTDDNENGVLEEDEENVAPGVAYYAEDDSLYKSLKGSFASDFYSDQWGFYISGFAPIIDSSGNPIAIFGVDFDVSELYKSARNRFQPIIWFLSIFVIILLIRISNLKNTEK